MYNIRQFKPVLYLLLLTGLSGFALAAQSPGLWALGAAGIGLNAWLVLTGRFVPMPRLLANAVTLAATLYSARQMLTNYGPPVIVIGQFLVLLHLIKLWEQRANRDYAQLLVLSLLLMVAAAINTASMAFGLLFAAYLFLSLYCCLLFHLKVETDAARAALALPEEDAASPERLRRDQRFLSRSMRRLTAFVSAVAVVTAVLVFLFFPRGSGANILGPLQFRPAQALTGFSDEVGFQKIAQIQQNDQVMAYVRVWKNQEPVEGGTLLLRGTTLDRYTGADDRGRGRWQWVRSRRSYQVYPHSVGPGETQPLARDRVAGDHYRQVIRLNPTGTPTLFGMPGIVSFSPQKKTVEIRYTTADAVLQTNATMQQPLEYEVVSRGALDLPEFNYALDPLTRPSTIDPQIAAYARRPEVSGSDAQGALAERRPRGGYGPHDLDEQIAANIERHLRTTFNYTLDLTDAKHIIGDQDPMVAFLYQLKRGHCEYFAGAMTLMCQSLGMQARVVTGFKCDEYNDTPGASYYIVRQNHAHAWVEVRTRGGWKTFDPTSGNEIGANRVTMWQRLKHLLDYMEFSYANNIIAYDGTNQENLVNNVETEMTNTMYRGVGWVARLREFLSSEQFDYITSHVVFVLVGLIVLVLVGFIGWYVWEQWALRRRAARIGLEALPPAEQLRLARQLGFYDDLLRLLARHDVHRPRHLTPMEFSRSLTFLPAQAYENVRRLTSIFYRVRYGGVELDAGQRKRLDRVIGRLEHELAALAPAGPTSAVPAPA
jgi:transglutaminase-like putative cysteine protease